MVRETVYYSDGKVYSTGRYRNGKKHGTIRVFYPNGSVYSEKNYFNGFLHGECKKWYAQGYLKSIILYIKGFKHGECTEWWHEYDQIKLKEFYVDGLLDGYRTRWDSMGQIISTEFYRDGKLQGLYSGLEYGYFQYYVDGNIICRNFTVHLKHIFLRIKSRLRIIANKKRYREMVKLIAPLKELCIKYV